MRISDWSSDVCSSDLRGVIHQHVDLAEGFHRGLNDLFRDVDVGKIAIDGFGYAPRITDGFGCAGGAFLTAGRDQYLGASFGYDMRDALSNARSRTGDDSDLTCKRLHALELLSRSEEYTSEL